MTYLFASLIVVGISVLICDAIDHWRWSNQRHNRRN